MIHGRLLLLLALWAAPVPRGAGDWPTLRGNPRRDGYVDADLPPKLGLAWAAEFAGERLGTALEPIVADRHVLITTHAGSVWALDVADGEPHWRAALGAPILHAPCAAAGRVVTATSDGRIVALASADGTLAWSATVDPAGFAASPLVVDGVVYLGSRGGRFFALSLDRGQVRWQVSLDAPIRQTAASAGGRVWVTAEDLRTHCLDARTGAITWSAAAARGQSARDYYPVVVNRSKATWVVVRTAPTRNMAQRITADRRVLARHAGFEDSDWRQVEAWTTGASADGTPERWRSEQAAVSDYLARDADAPSFFAFDAVTGQVLPPAPVLWVGGCQGVPAPPVALPDGRLLTLLRSAYGHWSHGVAPLVALGLLDLGAVRPAGPEAQAPVFEPLPHREGPKPPWNTFWGTADESQNAVVFRDTAVLVHQGTLSRFEWRTGRLTPIRGERDTFGGFRHPAWARNEWHGPARGGVGWSDDRLFWCTGSRVLCLAAGDHPVQPAPRTLVPAAVAGPPALPTLFPDRARLEQSLREAMAELTARQWAPLEIEPGLAGRSVFFDRPAESLEALAWAWPHLAEDQRAAASAWAREALEARPWFGPPPVPRPTPAARREYHPAPAQSPDGAPGNGQAAPLPFGDLAAAAWWARRTGETNLLTDQWPRWIGAWSDFLASGWRLDPGRGDRHANRYLASLLALQSLASQRGQTDLAAAAQAKAADTQQALLGWWNRSAANLAPHPFDGSRELDPFIGKGDGLFLALRPHRHCLGLFEGLTPEVAARVREQAPDAVEAVWRAFEGVCSTWWLVGEERQVHTGENLFDPPDFALSAFRAAAWLRSLPPAELAARVDIPFCRADLFQVMKLGMALDLLERRGDAPSP